MRRTSLPKSVRKKMSRSFACYRLPYGHDYVRVEQTKGSPRVLSSLSELDGCSGFVVAPFVATADCPLLLIQDDEVTRHPMADEEQGPLPQDCAATSEEERAAYHDAFALFHHELSEGRFQKIVLSRMSSVTLGQLVDAERLFLTACQCYPRMFVALVSTPQSGTWLMATPELLFQRQGTQCRTMALAGTMPATDEPASWSQKNIEEQRLVARYISEQVLRPYADDIVEDGPRPARAGHLLHLLSTFSFTLRQGTDIGQLLSALHPTPAVCGIPKDETLRFILLNEQAPRRYYSGFCGPVDKDEARLFVSLRCMQIEGNACRLYAGGGLLNDSQEQQEWEETQTKLQTMRRLLG